MTRRPLATLCALVLCLTLSLALAFDAMAGKRLGGGSNLGSKPSYNQNYSPSQPGGAQVPPRQSDMRQQAAPQQPGMQQPAQRPGGLFGGMFGGMGGMLTGMLVGGMLGSLLFGGGHGFAGPGLLDIVILAGGAWLLFRFLRSRREAPASGPQQFSQPGQSYQEAPNNQEAMRRESGWDHLRSTPPPQGYGQPSGPVLPPGFDETEFLKGAKAAYARLQESWNRRDLADLKSFLSPAVFAEIESQARQDPTPSVTEIIMVQALLLNVVQAGSETTATVLFDATLREDPNATQPSVVREVWHFVRDENRSGDMWRLDGIQQVN